MSKSIKNIRTKSSSESNLPKTRSGFKRMIRNSSVRIGGCIILFFIFIAIFGPLIAPYDPTKLGVAIRLLSPTWDFPFGSDALGRDILTRVMFGARITLYIGIVSISIGLLSGLIIGIFAGYAGGWVQAVLMRSVDFLYTFPDILIAIGLVAFFGPSLTNTMIAVGISLIPYYTRVTYSVTLVERNKPYFEAAQAIGAGRIRLILRHLLPNIIPPIIVVGSLGFSAAVLSAAALSFLGLGAMPPTPEWGKMLAENRDYILLAPWVLLFPGLAIMLTVLGFNILGDGIRDLLDPRLRKDIR